MRKSKKNIHRIRLFYTEGKQVKARHIMVNSMEEADDSSKGAKEGKPFEQVAQKSLNLLMPRRVERWE